MPEPLLEIQDLSVSFRTENGIVRAVDRLSLSIDVGEVVGIVGESGSGKTVAMLAVMRLIRDPNAIVEGRVLLRGRDVMQASPSEMRGVRGGEIAMIFQEPMTSLNPVMTVGDQIVEAVLLHQNVDHKGAVAIAAQALQEIGRAHV